MKITEFSPINWITENTEGEGIRNVNDAETLLKKCILMILNFDDKIKADEVERIMRRTLLEVHRLGYDTGYENGKEDAANGY